MAYGNITAGFGGLGPFTAAQPEHAFFFRGRPDLPGRNQAGRQTAKKTRPDTDDRDAGLLCRRCRRLITRTSERIEMQGAHQHAFANPHGLVFRIGCFQSARGCAYTGPLSPEFSWFMGYSWRIAVCGSCLNHLGWLFVPSTGAAFNGLILDQLVSE